MRIRLCHENKACDLTMTHQDTLGTLKNTSHQIFKIAYDRVRLVHDEKDLSTLPDSTSLTEAGIEDNSAVVADVLPPVVVQKKSLTAEDALAECEASTDEIKGKLDGLLQRVIECWQQGNPPSSEMLHTADTECKLCYELLTRLMLQLDGIEVDAELRVRRKALLKQIEGLQDGDCKVVKEAIKSQQEKVAAQPPSNATEPAE